MVTTYTLDYNSSLKNAKIYLDILEQPTYKGTITTLSSVFSTAIVSSLTYSAAYTASLAHAMLPALRCGQSVNVLKNAVVRLRLWCPQSNIHMTLFKGVITRVNSTLSSSADDVEIDITDYNYFLSKHNVIGKIIRKSVYDESLDGTSLLRFISGDECIFNKDGEKDRSSAFFRINPSASNISLDATITEAPKDYPEEINHQLAFPVFGAEDSTNNEYWTYEDILRYVLALYVFPYVSEYLEPITDEELYEFDSKKLGSTWPSDDPDRPFNIQAQDNFDLTGSNLTEALNSIFQSIEPNAFYWWLNSKEVAGKTSEFKWFRREGTSSPAINIAIPTTLGTQTRSIGFTPTDLSISENTMDSFDKIIVLGDFIGIQTTVILEELSDYTDEEVTDDVLDTDEESDYYGLEDEDEIKSKYPYKYRRFGLSEEYDFTELDAYLTANLGAPTDIYGNEVDTWFPRRPKIRFKRYTEIENEGKKKKLDIVVLKNESENSWKAAKEEDSIVVDEENCIISFSEPLFEHDYEPGEETDYSAHTLTHIPVAVVALIETGIRYKEIVTKDNAETTGTKIIMEEDARLIIRKDEYVSKEEVRDSDGISKLVGTAEDTGINYSLIGAPDAVTADEDESGIFRVLREDNDFLYVVNDANKLDDAANQFIAGRTKASKSVSISLPCINTLITPGKTIKTIENAGDYGRRRIITTGGSNSSESPVNCLITSVSHDFVNWKTSLEASG